MDLDNLSARTRIELIHHIFLLQERVAQLDAQRGELAQRYHLETRTLHRTIDRHKMASHRARQASLEIEKQLYALASYLEEEAYAPALREAAKQVRLGLVSNKAVEESKALLRERDEWRDRCLSTLEEDRLP